MIPLRLMAVALCGTMALTACTDPAQLNPDANYTQQGAITGGILGAATGLAVGGTSVKNAAIGAAIGAGAGALAGNQLDRQAEALRQSIGNPNIIINRQGDVLVVTMPQDILFPFDSAALRSDLQADIRTVGRSLLQYPNTTVQVLGHTDSDGDASYNQKLSLRRAQAVSSVLVAEGVPSSRIQSIGRGEDQPIASNLTAEGKQQNRRVEIVILPNS